MNINEKIQSPTLYSFRDDKDVLFETENYEIAYDKQIQYLLGDKKALSYKVVSKSGGTTVRDFGHETIRLHMISKNIDTSGSRVDKNGRYVW